MTTRAANAYRRVDVESAPKTQILDQMFRRLLADIESARQAIAGRDIRSKASAIDHGIQLITELRAALDHAAAPELCRNLAALYDHVLDRLAHASAFLEVKPLDEAAKVVTRLRSAFAEAAAAASAPTP